MESRDSSQGWEQRYSRAVVSMLRKRCGGGEDSYLVGTWITEGWNVVGEKVGSRL